MRKTRFVIDSNEKSYEGYTDGALWNGWECPWFTKEVAEEMMRDFIKEGGEAKYNSETDSYTFLGENWGSADVFGGEDVDTEDGIQHLYPIGAWCWIWDEVISEKKHFEIHISYSWGDEEEPIEFEAENRDLAFNRMLDMAIKELKTCMESYKTQYNLRVYPHHNKITLYYGYDNEECCYKLIELEGCK